MYHEGVLVPPIKICDAGCALPDIERLILANSRQPALVRGDMQAQIAVTQMGAARMKELCGRFGAATVTDAFAGILAGAAAELKSAIARLPPGTAAAEGFLDSDGVVVDQPVKLAVTVTIGDGEASFDFSGSDPQAKGPINLRPSMVEACVFYCLLGSLGPELHFNDGMRDVVRILYAPRTVTNAEPPAPVSNYQMVNLMLVDVILEAMAKLNPARANAHSGASSALGIAWAKARPGQSAMQYEIAGSAYGGGVGYDGASRSATHLSNLHTTPIEILESEFPWRISLFTLVPNSCGAGHWRGWLSLQREYVLLYDATVILRFNKTRFSPYPRRAVKLGARARFVVRPGTRQELETKASALRRDEYGRAFPAAERGRRRLWRPAPATARRLLTDLAEGYCVAGDGREARVWGRIGEHALHLPPPFCGGER